MESQKESNSKLNNNETEITNIDLKIFILHYDFLIFS